MIFRRLLFSYLLFVFCSVVKASDYKDTVVLNNGDIIQCEIISLKQMVLTVKTDYSDSDFKIEWEGVKSIVSVQYLILFSQREGRYYGKVRTVDRLDSIPTIRIYDEERGTTDIGLEDVVYIRRIRNKFLDRTYAKLGIGYNWTKAQNIQTSNLFGQARYVSSKNLVDLNYNYTKTTQDSVSDVFRTNASISYQRLIRKRFLLLLREDFLQNTEQRLRLRVSSSLGPGVIFMYNHYARGAFATGTSWNSERFYGDEPRNNSLELFGTFDFILYDWHNLDLTMNLTGYPSMTQLGRFRVDNLTSLTYDLPFDFFIGSTLNINYDNQPTEGASEVDFVYTFNFGWEWDP